MPKSVYYVGSHPIAGSEQRGVDFARDDLFEQADCILTATGTTNRSAIKILKDFWSRIGCRVKLMTPAEHDRIFARVSHLPHLTAAALLNAGNDKELRFAGRGFIDTSRVASGPSNIWSDILLANAGNCTRSIDKLKKELNEFKKALEAGDGAKLEKLLEVARARRSKLVRYKMSRKELI